MPKMKNINNLNILIVKMSAIGDVIHTLPALCAIRDHFPNAHITWLVEEIAADIITGHKALDRVIISKRKTWVRELFSKKCLSGIKHIFRFFKTLRDTEYDIIIDFQGLLKSAVMVFLAKGKKKTGFGKGMEHAEMSYLFYNCRVPAVSMEVHALDRYMILVKTLGISSKKIRYDLPISLKTKTDIRQKLIKAGVPLNNFLICINPSATWPSKLWIDKRFAEITAKLLDQDQISVVFTGSASDRNMIEKIIEMIHSASAKSAKEKNNPAMPVNFAGRTNLKELAALYEASDLLITTDTGPMHLGAASGTKVIAVFGPTAPWRTGPYGKNNIVISAKTGCSPCFKKTCPIKTHACMNEISTDKVWKSIKSIFYER